ncbi:MAG: transglycosylase domain-containing protein, partial [Propionibacteriaceae bacterium]|nr:transglycosylase domain-containing protein [Propionibacteriaceae bacterium]
MASQRPAQRGPNSSPPRKPAARKGKHAAGKPGKQGKRRAPLWLRILKWSMASLLLIAVAGFVGFSIVYASTPIPDANADFQTNTSFVYYEDGKSTIGSYQIQNRQTIPYADMSIYAVNAVVAAENRTFWSDPGISVPGMARAGLAALRGEEVTGASTITQQYIKVLYLTQEKTLTRKLHEIVLAAKMGQDM